MARVTPLRRGLENAGYVEVTPGNSELETDYLMYVNNADNQEKDITIVSSSPVFDREPINTPYNESVLITQGTKIVASVSEGEESGSSTITDPNVLQRVLRIEYLDADPEFVDSDVEFFYKDGVWYQGSREALKSIMRRDGFDGILNLRVHYPRIISGSRLKIVSKADVSSTEIAGDTIFHKEVTTFVDLGSDQLLGGYIDVALDLQATMDDGYTNSFDKLANWHGSYMNNIISVSISAYITNANDSVRSAPLDSNCTIFLPCALECQSVSTAFLEKLEMTNFMGEIQVKFVDGARSSQFRAIAQRFKGTEKYKEFDGSGVLKGKHYIELCMGSLDASAYMGILKPVLDSSNSYFQYKPVLAVGPGCFYVNGVKTVVAQIVLDFSRPFMFAVDMDKGELRFGWEGKWWNGSAFVTSNQQDLSDIPSVGSLAFVPEFLGYAPLTYGFAIGDYSETALDGLVRMKARRTHTHTNELVYTRPVGYESF